MNLQQDEEGGDADEAQVALLLRKRALVAAVKLLAQNQITDPEALDDLLNREKDYFNYKIKRNIRRDKLQTVLKLFGFRSVRQQDKDDPRPTVLERLPETEEQILETKVIGFYVKVEMVMRVLLCIAQLWYVIVVPFRCSFEVPRTQLSLLFEGIFIDLIMYLTVARRIMEPVDENGCLRWDGWNEKYIWSWTFAYDIIANVPLDYVGLAAGSTCTIALKECGVLAPYWQLNRMLNAREIIENGLVVCEALVQRLLLHPFVAMVIIVGIVQAYFWHLFACFMYLDALRLGRDFEIINVGGVHILEPNISLPLRYASSLDWGSKVLAGWDRGSASPVNVGSFIFNFVAVLFGICLMTTFVAFVSEVVEKITPYIQNTMGVDQIMELAHYKRFQPALRDEMVLDRWSRFDARTHMFQLSEVCGTDLPPVLYDRLMHHEGLRVLSRVKLFAPLLQNERFVIEIARLLKPVLLAPTEVVCNKGDEGDAMYFLVDGLLGVVDHEDHSVVKFTLKPGMFVGEIALLLGTSRTATVVVLHQFVRMLSLSRKDFDVLRRRFPNTFAEVHQKARERWLELNQPLLEIARDLGRKEIAELAKRRWEQLNLKEKLKQQQQQHQQQQQAADAAPGGKSTLVANTALLAVSKEKTSRLNASGRKSGSMRSDGGRGIASAEGSDVGSRGGSDVGGGGSDAGSGDGRAESRESGNSGGAGSGSEGARRGGGGAVDAVFSDSRNPSATGTPTSTPRHDGFESIPLSPVPNDDDEFGKKRSPRRRQHRETPPLRQHHRLPRHPNQLMPPRLQQQDPHNLTGAEESGREIMDDADDPHHSSGLPVSLFQRLRNQQLLQQRDEAEYAAGMNGGTTIVSSFGNNHFFPPPISLGAAALSSASSPGSRLASPGGSIGSRQISSASGARLSPSSSGSYRRAVSPGRKITAEDVINNIWAPRSRSGSRGRNLASAGGSRGRTNYNSNSTPVGVTGDGTPLVADDDRGLMMTRQMSNDTSNFVRQFLQDTMRDEAQRHHHHQQVAGVGAGGGAGGSDLPPNIAGRLPRPQQQQQQQQQQSPTAGIDRDGNLASPERPRSSTIGDRNNNSGKIRRGEMAPIVDFSLLDDDNEADLERIRAGSAYSNNRSVVADSLAASSLYPSSVFGERHMTESTNSVLDSHHYHHLGGPHASSSNDNSRQFSFNSVNSNMSAVSRASGGHGGADARTAANGAGGAGEGGGGGGVLYSHLLYGGSGLDTISPAEQAQDRPVLTLHDRAGSNSPSANGAVTAPASPQGPTPATSGNLDDMGLIVQPSAHEG